MALTSRLRKSAGALGALVALAVPMVTTQFAEAASASIPATTSVTLPLFGVQLTVDITTDGTGSLTNVAINPADNSTATTLKPNRVVFETTGPGGTGTITVSNHNGRQSVTVRGGTLADISGLGHWSGDLFGSSTTTSIDFTVGAQPDGSPDITGVSTSDPLAEIGAVKYSSENDEQEADVAIKFTLGTQTRTVTIRARVSTDTETSTTHASLKITLGPTRGVPQPAADVAGPHSWDGQLCNATLAHIDYTVGLDGTISGVTATPTPESVNGGEHGVQVRFSKNERVRLRADLENGMITLDTVESFRCDGTPGTNANVSLGSGDNNGSDDNGEGNHDGGDDSSTGPTGASGEDEGGSGNHDGGKGGKGNSGEGATSGPSGVTGVTGDSGHHGGPHA